MSTGVRLLMAGVVLVLAAGCGGGDGGPHTGTVEVTVTLSRQGGGVGPTIDHAPQRDQAVTVVGGTHKYSGVTDEKGVARMKVPVGEYDVEAPGCPNAPQHVSVTKGAQLSVEVDCVAA